MQLYNFAHAVPASHPHRLEAIEVGSCDDIQLYNPPLALAFSPRTS